MRRKVPQHRLRDGTVSDQSDALSCSHFVLRPLSAGAILFCEERLSKALLQWNV
jgi:hypothetical protein